MRINSMIRLAIGIAFLCTYMMLEYTPAAADEPAPIRTLFLGTPSLEDLMRGAAGQGFLVFFSDGWSTKEPVLVVRFVNVPETGQAIAEVFDAGSQPIAQPFRLDGDQLVLDEAVRPVVRMWAIDGWWVREGVVNYNLHVQTMGPIYSMWGAGSAGNSTSGWLTEVVPGQLAVDIQVRDPAYTGVPTYDLRNLLLDFPGKGYYRTNYAERTCATPLVPEPGVVPQWPFVAMSGEYEQSVGRLRPPIVVDWSTGTVKYFSELVTVRNQNCSYSLYSIERIKPDQLNRANFETPFAFYDLSGEGVGYPNLILRTEYFPANDPWSANIDSFVQQGRPAPRDIQRIRYSWRHAIGDARWDYKVEVLGFHAYDFATQIAGGLASINAPSYGQFPAWVVETQWPVATFVDTEGSNYRSSEGIYEWSPHELGVGYLFGWDDRPAAEAFTDIRQGLRGEYRFTDAARPLLYLSPIDQRLHLLGAEGGVYRISADQVVRLHNLDGGDYLNGWTRERVSLGNVTRSGEIEEALYALDGYLIYASPDGVTIRRAHYQNALFQASPPSDHASWQRLRALVDPYRDQRRNYADLYQWLEHFPGSTVVLAGATLDQIRTTADGFQFVLSLKPGFRVSSEEFFDLPYLNSGQYIVTLSDDQWTIVPAVPPDSSDLSLKLITDRYIERGASSIAVLLHNQAVQDLPEATLEVWATPEQGQQALLVSQEVELLAQQPVTTTVQWVPPQAGSWTLTPRLVLPDDTIGFDPVVVTVLPASPIDVRALLVISTQTPALFFAIVLLGAIASLCAALYWAILRRT